MQAIGRLEETPAVPRQGASVEPAAPRARLPRRRNAASDRDVRGPCRLDGAHAPTRSRSRSRYFASLPGTRGGRDGPCRRLSGEIHGRRRVAYFGWPRAHEDDAERAVRAGLAITDAVPELRLLDGESLACRVGIATGPVVVGDLVGEGRSREEAVVGDTPI